MEDITFSLFKGYADTLPADATLSEIIRMIRQDPTVKEHTLKHRYYASQGNAAAADKEKSSCPCFSVAVRFQGGKRKRHICGWTSVGLVDIDHLEKAALPELLKRIVADPHTLLTYTTISGAGIRILYRMEHDENTLQRAVASPLDENAYLASEAHYRAAFLLANDYYARLLGVECDLKCKNSTRLCGLAHDPELFFNPDALPFRAEVVPKIRKRMRNYRLERAVTTARKELEAQGVTYEPHQHNDYIMRMGYLLNRYGIDQDQATEWALNTFTGYDGDIAGIFRSCYLQTEEFGTKVPTTGKNHARQPLAGVAEIEDFLCGQGSFRRNVITGKYEVDFTRENREEDFREVDDHIVNSLWARMSKTNNRVRISDLRNVLESEFVADYNPFQLYFDGLDPWDGQTDYIGELADTLHTVQGPEDCRKYLKKWLVGCVAALFDRSVVNHEILVLAGPQATYKTTWLNNLLPPELRKYFCVKSDFAQMTKDDQLRLTEFALICLEEIEELRPEALSRIKAVSTTLIINERRAYGHFKESKPHIASFCGTTNNVNFLTDVSGDRRWFPMEITAIDDPYTHPVNYRGVYAQAYALWKSRFRYWLSSSEVAEVNRRNEYFRAPDLEADQIQTYFRRPLPGEAAVFITTAQIISRISGGIRQLMSPAKVNQLMKKLGFEAVRSGNKRGYLVVELTLDQVNQNRSALGHYLRDECCSES